MVQAAQKAGIKTSEFWGLVGAGATAVAYAPEPYSWAIPAILSGLWTIIRAAVKAGWIRGTVGHQVGELEAGQAR